MKTFAFFRRGRRNATAVFKNLAGAYSVLDNFASAFVLSGSSTGTTNNPTTFLVTPNGAVATTMVVTVAATAATVSPTQLTFTAGSSAAQTFTVTRSTDGTSSVSITNNGGLLNTGSPISYTSATAASSADFLARRSGANVIWYQGFDANAEVTAFAKPRDTNLHSVPLYREADPVVGSALVFKFLGARLAADFLASGGNGPRTMVLDDASEWPTTFPFRFFVTRVPLGDSVTRKKTLFECSARSGNNLTVTYIPYNISEFDSGASFMDRFIGDAAGSECQNYTRLFSAMSGADNGRGVNDPAASGTLPVRSRIVGNPNYVPQTPSLFGYGYCAHPDYQSDSRFNPWIPNFQGSGGGDSTSRSNVTDTNDIYIQLRAWLDAKTQLVDMQGGKIVGLQVETTVPQQIVMGMGPGAGIFDIPSTPEVPFKLAKFNYATYGSAGMVMTANPYDDFNSSYQPGSTDPVTGKSWEVTAKNAVSGQPSTGQNTPDGSSAFEHKYGRWVTFQWRIKPGKNWHYSVPLRNAWDSATQTSLTLINDPTEWPTGSFQIQLERNTAEVNAGVPVAVFNVASRSGAVLNGVTLASGTHRTLSAFDSRSIIKIPATPAGTGVLNTLLEVKFADYGDTQYKTLFSDNDIPLVYGSRGQYAQFFDQAIPGFNALELWGYRNTDLSSTAPYKTHYQKFAQLICSKTEIPVPSVWPFTLPASGTIGSISTNTLQSTTADPNEHFSMPKVLSAWGSAAVSLIKSGSAVTDIVYWIFGGGHGDTANDAVYCWTASTGLFSRPLAPSPSAVALMAIPACDPTTDTVHGEDIFGRPDSQHVYNHIHGLDSDDVYGPALMQVYGTAIGQAAIKAGQAHRFVRATNTWERWADVAPVSISDAACVIKDTLRKKFVRFPSDNGTAFYTLDYTNAAATWQTLAQSARTGNWSATFEAVGIYDPVRDLYIAGTQRGVGSNLRAVSAATPTGAWTELTFTGTGPTNFYGHGLMYRSANDTFLMVDTSTNPPTGIYVLTPPATNPLTNPWTWTRRAFTGTSRYQTDLSSGTECFDRFQYVAALDAVICCGSHTNFMEAWKL